MSLWSSLKQEARRWARTPNEAAWIAQTRPILFPDYLPRSDADKLKIERAMPVLFRCASLFAWQNMMSQLAFGMTILAAYFIDFSSPVESICMLMAVNQVPRLLGALPIQRQPGLQDISITNLALPLVDLAPEAHVGTMMTMLTGALSELGHSSLGAIIGVLRYLGLFSVFSGFASLLINDDAQFQKLMVLGMYFFSQFSVYNYGLISVGSPSIPIRKLLRPCAGSAAQLVPAVNQAYEHLAGFRNYTHEERFKVTTMLRAGFEMTFSEADSEWAMVAAIQVGVLLDISMRFWFSSPLAMAALRYVSMGSLLMLNDHFRWHLPHTHKVTPVQTISKAIEGKAPEQHLEAIQTWMLNAVGSSSRRERAVGPSIATKAAIFSLGSLLGELLLLKATAAFPAYKSGYGIAKAAVPGFMGAVPACLVTFGYVQREDPVDRPAANVV